MTEQAVLMTNAVVLMTKTEARSITERIRSSVDDLAGLLDEAHGREAWRSLGYKSWGAYIDGEFDFSRRHSYRLLEQAKAMRQIEEATGEHVHITRRDAAEIVKDGTIVTHGSQLATSGESVSAAMQAALAEQRERAAPKSKHRSSAALDLDGQLRKLREEIDGIAERLEGDALEFMDTTMLERTFSAVVATAQGVLNRIAEQQRGEWSA